MEVKRYFHFTVVVLLDMQHVRDLSLVSTQELTTLFFIARLPPPLPPFTQHGSLL